MAGTVYLKTNRFEVKLEGITFKAQDFESLCTMDFLFPECKIWLRPPVVGLDVMRHPRDPNIMLVLLCFGAGCVILRFHSGDSLPDRIFKFLTDNRIRFVGFGIPEKKDMFPFQELGLTKTKVDIGYLAAKHLNDPKFKRCELAELARKVLGIKRMVGLTEASSFERHEQIKCAICQLFISNVIAMALLGQDNKKRTEDSPKKSSFLKNLNSLALLNEGWLKLSKKTLLSEGWFKLHKAKKDNDKDQSIESGYGVCVHVNGEEDAMVINDIFHTRGNGNTTPSDDSSKEAVSSMKMPMKGILKSPATEFQGCNLSPPNLCSPPSKSKVQQTATGPYLKRANSKGHNVSFKY
ncbi:unnamed protein product [Ilex paraguariensis]|uniref:3'-5' exonuclease domain-containing protein n=1 Tax=Ilex paraguariensis TaxID=185542 RepID=A0ABC8SBK2_9AQUA